MGRGLSRDFEKKVLFHGDFLGAVLVFCKLGFVGLFDRTGQYVSGGHLIRRLRRHLLLQEKASVTATS